jgi:hypothetical protein
MSWIESLSSSTHDREREVRAQLGQWSSFSDKSVIRQMADLQRPKLAKSKKAQNSGVYPGRYLATI